MEKSVISTNNAPAAIGPYSQAIKAGNFVFASGQIPIVPATGEILRGDIKLQTRQALENLKHILEASGSCIDNVVKTTVFMKDLNDYTSMNDVYKEFFTSNPLPGLQFRRQGCPGMWAWRSRPLPLAFKKKI